MSTEVVPETASDGTEFPTKLVIEGASFDRCSISKDGKSASYRCDKYRRFKCICRANGKMGKWVLKGVHNDKCKQRNEITSVATQDGSALDVTVVQREFVEHMALNNMSYPPSKIYSEMLKAFGELSTVTVSLKRNEVSHHLVVY